MEFYQIRARSQCSQHGRISPSIYFNVGFACLARAVKAQRGQQYLPPAWSFFAKRGVSRRISASGKHKEYLELNWISKILWFWFTTCSCVPASSISSRELQEDILMYGHVPYLLRSPCFLPHSPRQRPGSGWSSLIVVFCLNDKCWAFSVGCAAFPAVSTQVPVVWPPSRRSLVPKPFHSFPAPTSHTFPSRGTVLGRTWQADPSSHYRLCVYVGSDLRWVHSCPYSFRWEPDSHETAQPGHLT